MFPLLQKVSLCLPLPVPILPGVTSLLTSGTVDHSLPLLEFHMKGIIQYELLGQVSFTYYDVSISEVNYLFLNNCLPPTLSPGVELALVEVLQSTNEETRKQWPSPLYPSTS